MGIPKTRGELEQQLADQRTVLAHTEAATDESSLRKRGVALWQSGEALFLLERFEEARGTLSVAAATLWAYADERGTAVYARLREAMAFGHLGRDGDALEVLDDLVTEIGVDWSDADFPDLMPVVLSFWMGLLRESGALDEAEAVAEVVLNWPAGAATATQRLTIATALSQKATAEVLRGSLEDALELLDQLISRCNEEEGREFDDEFRSLLVHGLVMRAFTLEHCGETEQALAEYEDVLARYDGASGADIVSMLSDARAGSRRTRPDS